jgi:hypothetical protein
LTDLFTVQEGTWIKVVNSFTYDELAERKAREKRGKALELLSPVSDLLLHSEPIVILAGFREPE